MPATVQRIEYDPNRSAFIALVKYEDGELRYILAPLGLKAGDTVVSSASADIKPGNCLPLANIPVGTIIHNIEINPGRGAQLVRSAGDYAQLMAKRRAGSVCRPAKSVSSARIASQSSARSATSTMRTSTSARPAVPATWASARRSAAPS